jgi:hypothetical protein
MLKPVETTPSARRTAVNARKQEKSSSETKAARSNGVASEHDPQGGPHDFAGTVQGKNRSHPAKRSGLPGPGRRAKSASWASASSCSGCESGA